MILTLLLFFLPGMPFQDRSSSCKDCPKWNLLQQPFKIYGNAYYVGTHGLGSILIASPGGHVLIDGGLPESVPQIAAHIRALGFRVEDIKLIVNSHVHFDHAGGIAELQRLSGARVEASPWSAAVMRKGGVARDDPQFDPAMIPITRVDRVTTVKDGETLHAGSIALTAHFTPGHTPGGTSWTWQSCENGRCLNLVYADSLTPVSSDSFVFTRDYPRAVDDFERSYTFLENTRCDILITPHPEFTKLWERLEKRRSDPDALIDPAACRSYAGNSRNSFKERLATERRLP